MTIIAGVRQLVTAISSSSGATSANKIVATAGNGYLDISLMPPGIGSNVVTIPASEALSAGDFINIWNNAGARNVRKADAAANKPAHGFVLAAVASGANAAVYEQGENTALTGLTPGMAMYLSATTPGAATATAPGGANQLYQEIGFALSTTSILFEYSGYTLIV